MSKIEIGAPYTHFINNFMPSALDSVLSEEGLKENAGVNLYPDEKRLIERNAFLDFILRTVLCITN